MKNKKLTVKEMLKEIEKLKKFQTETKPLMEKHHKSHKRTIYFGMGLTVFMGGMAIAEILVLDSPYFATFMIGLLVVKGIFDEKTVLMYVKRSYRDIMFHADHLQRTIDKVKKDIEEDEANKTKVKKKSTKA